MTDESADSDIQGTNAGTRYEDTLPDDTPEHMPLDSNLFLDLEYAVRWNVAGTRHLPLDDPNRFDQNKDVIPFGQNGNASKTVE